MATVASVASAHRQGCSGTCQTQRRKLLAFSHSPLGAPSWGSKSSRPKPVSRSGPLASGVPARAVPFDYANVAAGGGKVPGLPRAFRAGVYSSPGLTKLSGKSARCGGRQALPPAHDSRQKAPRRRHINQCSGFAPSARRASGSREGAGGRRGAIASGNSRGLAGGREAYRSSLAPSSCGGRQRMIILVASRPAFSDRPGNLRRSSTTAATPVMEPSNGTPPPGATLGVVSLSCRRAALRRVPAACRCGGAGCLPVCQSHADRPFARTPPVWIRCRGQYGT